MPRHTVFALAIVIFSPVIQADIFGPDNFDECVTESMKGVTSDLAARAIIKSCRELFPDKNKANTRELSYEERTQLTGKARDLSYNSGFGGYLYNGNSEITITEVTISLTPIDVEDAEPRRYRVPVTLRPLARADFSFKFVRVDGVTGYKWSIVSAKGYESN